MMADFNSPTISSPCIFTCTLAAIIGLQFFSAIGQDIQMDTTENFITQSTSCSDIMEETETTPTPAEFNSIPPPLSVQSPVKKANPCRCGVRSVAPSGKIVGGTPILDDEEWPWFATLVHVNNPTKAHCGASLISPRYVLTAAHCLLPMMQIGLKNFKVNLGSNNLSNPDRDSLQVSIESVTVHPEFEQSFPYHYDLGLIKLSSPVKCNRKVRPICLPELKNDSLFAEGNALGMVAGFGKNGINGNYSQLLQMIEVNLVPNDECRYNFSKLSYSGPAILENMLCAWGKGKDSCVGDSGGPLIVRREGRRRKFNSLISSSTYFQVGITSWGIGCANERYPGVYTRVDKYVSWIKSIVLDL